MTGGDTPYDDEGGGPADGTPWQPAQPSQPPRPPEIAEPAARAAPAPPPMAEPTGDERVDAALSRLGELSAAPVADHVEVFEDVHRRLQDVLASVDHDDHDEQPETATAEDASGSASRPGPGPPSWGS